MANNAKRTAVAANAACDAMTALANGGLLRIYSSNQPATAAAAFNSAAPGDQVLLAELTMNATAFAPAVAGVATANAITSDPSANNTGTAGWFRVLDSGGVDVTDNLWDGSVGTGGADLNLATTSIAAGVAVAITSFTVTENLG
jgi:hypothetical protein